MKLTGRATFAEQSRQIHRARMKMLHWKFIIGIALVVNLVLGSFNGYAYYKHKKGEFLFSDWQPAWKGANYSYVGPIWAENSATYADGTPRMVMIRGEIWPIREVASYEDTVKHLHEKSFKGVGAQTDCERKEITYIHAESRRDLQTNLMHEVLHAGSCAYGGDAFWMSPDATGDDHPGIKHLGEFLSSFVRDNPTFISWMEK